MGLHDVVRTFLLLVETFRTLTGESGQVGEGGSSTLSEKLFFCTIEVKVTRTACSTLPCVSDGGKKALPVNVGAGGITALQSINYNHSISLHGLGKRVSSTDFVLVLT